MSGKSLCTLLVPLDKRCLSTAEEIQADLEGSDAGAKADALKRAIMLLLNGHMVPNLLATVVRQVLPSQERTIQRLLLLYLEVVADERDKVSGNFIPENEMIVISHHLRSNLHHPNEHIRAVTLRLLCRLREPELLQPLVPSILANLRNPHPLVRRHVFSAVSAVYRRRDGRRLIPDAPSVVERALAMEQDPTARRNAFLMLCDCDLSQVPATRYLLGNADRFAEWPAALQTAAVGFVRRVHGNLCHNRCICLLRRGYTEIIASLLSASTAAVIYDCACTLLRVSSEPTSIHTAAKAYCQLLTSQRSDNKVKLVILDRLHELCTSQLHYLMVDFVRNILRSLTTPDLDVRSKALDLVLGLLTAQNVDDVVRYLKHEFFRTPSGLLRMADDYRRTMLVRAIHACAMEYPRVAISVVPILSNFLGCSDASLSYDIVLFLGEFIEAERFLRLSVLHGLIDKLCRIKESFICSCALWIIGEYSCSLLVIERAISTIKEALGDEPYFHVVSQESESGDSSKPTHHPAMDSSTICSKRRVIPSNSTHNLRVLILSGDFHLAAVVACTLTKLVLRLEEFQPSKVKVNEASAESLRIMVSMLQLGKSSHLPRPIDSDSYDRIVFCVRLLCRTGNNARKVWLLSSCQSFTKMLAEKQFRKNVKMKDESQNSHANPDDSIDFYHLKSRRGICQLELEDELRDDLKAPTVQFMKDAGCANKLNRPVRLTGFSDPVYVEGSVTVNQYHDTVLDITVINRTKETMRNLRLEFATACKTTVVERSRNYTVAPRAVKNIQANIQLSSTNLGIIISRIVYETSDAMESSELKVNTVLHDEKEFVNFIIKSTNMTCLTPMSALDGDCGLVAANLYAKSVFGEDALVNISIEKEANRKLSGYITIRGNVQGLVLNLAHAVIATPQATVVDAAMSLSEACHKYYR